MRPRKPVYDQILAHLISDIGRPVTVEIDRTTSARIATLRAGLYRARDRYNDGLKQLGEPSVIVYIHITPIDDKHVTVTASTPADSPFKLSNSNSN